MKIWKRNAIVATVLVLICAGVYYNWNASQAEPVDLTEMLDVEQVMGDASLVIEGDSMTLTEETIEVSPEDSFAQIRLSRQQTRDSAVELLQETIAYEDGSESANAAAETLDELVGNALAESQIESLILAKGYQDCVAYMGEELISLAVSAPQEGLSDADVALISDIITAQTDYELEEIRIIEVK